MGRGDEVVVQAGDAHRNARLYLGGLAASLIGNSAMSLVAGVWVKSLTGSSAEAGLVSACVYAPSLAQRTTPIPLQRRVLAAITVALFGPQAPTQALGSLVIAHATYTQVYVASATGSAGIAAWLISRAAVTGRGAAD